MSQEWIPDFANFRRDGYDFDARWDDGLASYKDKELYEAIANEGTILSKRLKEALNYRKGGNNRRIVECRQEICSDVPNVGWVLCH